MIYTFTVDFYGIHRRPCYITDAHSHLPHFWYSQELMRRYFCKGEYL